MIRVGMAFFFGMPEPGKIGRAEELEVTSLLGKEIHPAVK